MEKNLTIGHGTIGAKNLLYLEESYFLLCQTNEKIKNTLF
jgi:hypothetical protein